MTDFFITMKMYVRIGLLTAIASLSICLLNEYKVIRADEEVFDIKFNNGQLSVKLKDAPLEKVLKEIMSQSGARIWLNDSIDMNVT